MFIVIMSSSTSILYEVDKDSVKAVRSIFLFLWSIDTFRLRTRTINVHGIMTVVGMSTESRYLNGAEYK